MHGGGGIFRKRSVDTGEESIFFVRTVHNEGMIKPNNDIARVKRRILTYREKQVDVTVRLGRNKVQQLRGVLTGVYPALFTVRPDDENFLGKTAYSYAEVLCGSIDIRLAQPEKTGV